MMATQQAVQTADAHDGDAPAAGPGPGDRLGRGALLAAAIATGLIAGFFFAYQVSVTRGLAIVDAATYVETMNAINATIRNAGFGAAFFGAVPLGLAALVAHLRPPRGPAAALVAAGVLLYLATLAITAGVSIPLNEQLAAQASVPGADLGQVRIAYEDPWNAANAVRTATALGAFASLAAGLLLTGRGARRGTGPGGGHPTVRRAGDDGAVRP